MTKEKEASDEISGASFVWELTSFQIANKLPIKMWQYNKKASESHDPLAFCRDYCTLLPFKIFLYDWSFIRLEINLITQRLLWKLTSATVFLTTPWQTTHHATVTAARPLVACYHRDARMQVTSDADKDSVLPLHMPFKKDTGNSQKWGSPFSIITICNILIHIIIKL